MNGNNKYIVVDAGHGGSDPGAVNGNVKEKDLNLKSALYIYNRLKELGVPVAITRNYDEDLSRSDRLSRMVNTFGNNPDVIVLSNHINAGGGEGAEVVYALRNNDTLAKMILNEIGNKGQVQRKVYQRRLPEDPTKDYYYIMRQTGKVEPVLIEYGFIDNPRDLAKLQNNLEDYAEGVVKAVANYINVSYTAPISDSLTNVYTVKKGDTLYAIATANDISVDELKRLNNLSSNILTIGQKLVIPTREEILQEDYTIYTVKNGDTLYSIAREFNTSVEELLTLNKLYSTSLNIGQQLLIPKGGIEIVGVVDYVIKPGDSLWKIANNCNATVEDIIKLNNLDSTIIYPGQIIKLSETCRAKQNNNNEEQEVEDIYIVKNGDTLYSISRMFNTTVDQIKEDNNLNSNFLSIGQQLKVPRTTNYIEYVIKPGDTLYSIARRYNTTPNIISELNNLNSTILQINQTLLLPKENVQ